jgi:aminopeptidase
MDESLHDRYARRLGKLAVEVGANVAAGQDVLVLAMDVQQAPIARAIGESAYESGARYVTVLYWDQHAKRSRLRHAPADSLDFVPVWYERLIADCIERRSAVIVVWGDPDPALLSDVDAARVGADHMPLTPSLFAAMGGGEVNWTFVPGPCEGIAQRLLGTPDLDQLWSLVAPIIRLDQDDPVGAWRDHLEQLALRAEQLAERRFDALHFDGPQTDLTVGLMSRARWMSGGITTSWGRSTVANMPTEEVFTTPDARRTEGTVRATRPVQLLGGGMVEGLRLRFSASRAVEIDADTGPTCFSPASPRTRAPPGWARSRWSTVHPPSVAAAVSSGTSCSTRTRPVTSRWEAPIPSPSPTFPTATTRRRRSASTARRSTRTP